MGKISALPPGMLFVIAVAASSTNGLLLSPGSVSLRPSLASAVNVRLSETDPESTERAAWPEPAFSVSELQAQQAQAKEEAEQAAMASPKPFIEEGGSFNVVALATVVVFVLGGAAFFQGISAGGMAQFAADQTPEVQACIKKATTRQEASACLPPVPVS